MLRVTCKPFIPNDLLIKKLNTFRRKNPYLIITLRVDTFQFTSTDISLNRNPFFKWLNEHWAVIKVNEIIRTYCK